VKEQELEADRLALSRQIVFEDYFADHIIQSKLINLNLGSLDQLIVVRSAINHSISPVIDSGHILGARNEVNAIARRSHEIAVIIISKITGPQKDVGRWPDVVVVVGPAFDLYLLIGLRLGWQRRPTDVIITFTPRNPGRNPLIAGNPNISSVI
jgi:hypothetical protein